MEADVQVVKAIRKKGRSLCRLPRTWWKLGSAAAFGAVGPDGPLHLPAEQGIERGLPLGAAVGCLPQKSICCRTCSMLRHTSQRSGHVRPRSRPIPRAALGKSNADETLCATRHLCAFIGQKEIPRVARDHCAELSSRCATSRPASASTTLATWRASLGC